MLEGRQLTTTDYRPLVRVFRASADHHSLREIRQLDFILQFTSDIRCIDSKDHAVANVLSLMELSHIASTSIEFEELAANQESDPDLAEITANPSWRLECFALFTGRLFTVKSTMMLRGNTIPPLPWNVTSK